MIVYRCVCERDLANMLGIQNEVCGPRGNNTFNYDYNKEYRHFYYFYDSAKSFMSMQNEDRYYNKYSNIIAYDIDDQLLKESFGLGKYNLDCVKNDNKDILLKYFKHIYYPEFCIPVELISNDMIVGIGDSNRITPVNKTGHYELENILRKSEMAFLNYEKWLFKNGTNVKQKLVLEHKEELFPINERKLSKIKRIV